MSFFGYLVPLAISGFTDSKFNLHFISFMISILGFLIFIPAAFLVSFGIEALTTRGSGTANPKAPPQKLVIEGIYQKIQHPIFLGWSMLVLSTSLILGSISLLFISFVLIIFCDWYAKKEEGELVKRFGKAYLAYRNKVFRGIPKFY